MFERPSNKRRGDSLDVVDSPEGTIYEPSFYLRGYSGLALRFARLLFKVTGTAKHARAICSAKTITEQVEIYEKHIRPILLNPLVAMFLRTPMFCWNALGVPMNQLDMLLREGSVWEFVRDTFDGVPRAGLLGRGAYHYLLVRHLFVGSASSILKYSLCTDSLGSLYPVVVSTIPNKERI